MEYADAQNYTREERERDTGECVRACTHKSARCADDMDEKKKPKNLALARLFKVSDVAHVFIVAMIGIFE